MISVVRAGPKQPPNPLANPFVIPSGATEEEVETYWRPLVSVRSMARAPLGGTFSPFLRIVPQR